MLSAIDRRMEAAERMERALEALGEDGDPEATAMLCSRLAQAHATTGSPEVALAWAERALPIAERLDIPEVIIEALDAKGAALYNLARHREAAILGRGELSLAEEMGSLRYQGWALLAVGVAVSEENPAGALQAWLECADLGRRAGDRVTEMIALPNCAEAATELGRWEEADKVLHRLEGRELSHVARYGIAFCEVLLQAHRGDPAAAAQRLDEMAGGVRAAEMLPLRTWFHRASALVQLLNGIAAAAFDEAIGSLDLEPSGMNAHLAVREAARAGVWSKDPERVKRAVDAMEPLRGRWSNAVRRTAEAGLAALESRREDALAGYERALEDWRSLESRLDLAFCAVDMAHVLPNEEITREAVAEARSILTEIGGVALLERLDAATSASTPAQASSS